MDFFRFNNIKNWKLSNVIDHYQAKYNDSHNHRIFDRIKKDLKLVAEDKLSEGKKIKRTKSFLVGRCVLVNE
jgi:hypothetical protein